MKLALYNQPSHILYLPKWYPSIFNKMNGIFIQKHAQAVIEYSNTKITVLHSSTIPQMKNGKPFYSNTSSPRVFQKFNVNTGFPPLNFLTSIIGLFGLLRKLDQPIDLVHVHVLGRQAILALYFKWLKGIPFILTEHWTAFIPETNTVFHPIKKWFYKLVCTQASEITTVSQHLGESMKQMGLLENYSVISNVVDTNLFDIAKPYSTNKTHIVHVSNLGNAHKRFDVILAALAKLIEQGYNIHFHVIGDGPDAASQKELAKNLSLEKQVTFYGSLPAEEVAEIVKKCHFIVLYSRFETQSVALLEAISSGLPVVTSNLKCVSEFINKSNGILVDGTNETALSNALIEMIANYIEYDKKTIRDKALELCSKEVVGQSINSLYQKVIHK